MEATSESQECLQLRSYQREMLDRSIQGNVIVAMDTGSGKTHIALQRIREETERSEHKLIWFLAPTVALCEQQHDQIQRNLPALRTRLLTGSDNVDRWSEQYIWDCALEEIQVVVSTYAVLADALMHGFVTMPQLSLIVFDEAHHCNKDHPANKIMRGFYHPHKELYGSTQVPCILGLTASPILRSKIEELRVIEANLDSVCVSPRITREELMKHVHHPKIVELEYDVYQASSGIATCQPLSILKGICENMTGMGLLTRIPGSRSTWSRSGLDQLDEDGQQMFQFFRKAAHVFEELGSWAAEYFIAERVEALDIHLKSSTDVMADLETLQKVYHLLDLDTLRRIPSRDDLSNTRTSAKVNTLLQILAKTDLKVTNGIVFVQQRVIASVLCTLLSLHPSTDDELSCATFVGVANSSARKYAMTELLDLKAQRQTLVEFRKGRTNFLVATEALEEGIDVSVCNLVICFNESANVKSFIQRRGRARKEQSCFAILTPRGFKGQKLTEWSGLEAQLIKAYQEHRQRIDQLQAIESKDEHVPGRLVSSCAVITPVDAPAHLYHFCQTLPDQLFVVRKPLFKYDHGPVDGRTQRAECRITATVDLPICLPQFLRHFRSQAAWLSEKAARRDVAFQAYCALKKAELLSENLLPLSHPIELKEGNDPLAVGGVVQTQTQWTPWAELAEAWQDSCPCRLRVRLSDASPDGAEDLCMILTLPMAIARLPPLTLFWDRVTGFRISFEEYEEDKHVDLATLHQRRRTMQLLMQAHRSVSATDDSGDFIAIISPQVSDVKLPAWLEMNQGRRPATEMYSSNSISQGFIRSTKMFNRPYLFHGLDTASMVGGKLTGLELQCFPLPARRNFIDRPQGQRSDSCKSAMETLMLEDCTVDCLPFVYARFGMFIPAILQHIERFLVADRLRKKVFRNRDICGLETLAVAITAPSAAWISDYEEFEFFGDTVLKYIVSFQLYCQHPFWHEGYLTARRNQLVSNQNLARRAIALGLDEFIITKSMNHKLWSAPVLTDLAETSPRTRSLPSKLLADVVEALIGAAYLDNGLQDAINCLQILIPETATMLSTAVLPESPILDRAHRLLGEAEHMIGYSFNNKSILLEALTHGSCQSSVQTASWQRLEFLGDAVLDMVVVSYLSSIRSTSKSVNAAQMTRMKAALVNAQILGFWCIHCSITEGSKEVVESESGFSIEENLKVRRLWQLIRYSDTKLAQMLTDTVARYQDVHLSMLGCLQDGIAYPWVLLARLDPPKVFSDMVESIIGAIFVDSGARLESCEVFVKRIGLWSYMERLAFGKVDLTHPKTLLARAAKDSEVTYMSEQEKSCITGQVVHSCCISVGEVQLARAEACFSRDEAILVAASKAATGLETLPCRFKSFGTD